MWFLPLISYWEVTTFIFCDYCCFWSAWFALWCKRISFDLFWNAVSSSLPLNKGFRLFNFLESASWIRINSKRFSFSAWMRTVSKVMFCHAKTTAHLDLCFSLPGLDSCKLPSVEAQQMNIHKSANITIHNTFMSLSLIHIWRCRRRG